MLPRTEGKRRTFFSKQAVFPKARLLSLINEETFSQLLLVYRSRSTRQVISDTVLECSVILIRFYLVEGAIFLVSTRSR